MKEITREQLLIVKRTAIDCYFWDVAGDDDDNGFDRLMRLDRNGPLPDMSRFKEFELMSGVYLHKHLCWDSLTVEQIQNWVFGKAVQLLCGLCGVPLQEGMNMLFHTRTSESAGDSHTRLPHSLMAFTFPEG